MNKKISQKSLAWWLIFSGIVLLSLNIVIYDLLIFYWSIFLEFYWVVILLSSVVIMSIIIGGKKMKYNVTSWIVLSGVILIFVSLILSSLFTSLGGILLSYNSMPMILIIIGLVSVVVAALFNEKWVQAYSGKSLCERQTIPVLFRD